MLIVKGIRMNCDGCRVIRRRGRVVLVHAGQSRCTQRRD